MNGKDLGFLAIERGDYQEAVNLFRRKMGKNGDASSFLGLGISHFLLEDYPTAKWAFHKALERDPGNGDAIKHIAEIERRERNGGSGKKPVSGSGKGRFRTGGNYLEVHRERWEKIFLKGINIGIGLPGYFPGEYPVKKGTYRKWFRQISDLGINAIRIYTIHAPHFYDALEEWNRSGKTLYLLQGIWAEPPGNNDYADDRYLSYTRENIRNAIDAIHGDIELPPRPGSPHGKYRADVSSATIGFIFGREWEPCSVRRFNESLGRKRADYQGRFLRIADGTPFEVWMTKVSDFLQTYEHERYGTSRPSSVVNWPTLDPLRHPSESAYEDELARQGLFVRTGVCNENEDMEALDVSKISTDSGSGFFATYHAYPYYPDFMNNDYRTEKTPYLAYLRAIKAHHGDQPVLLAEFGVPSSREYAHKHRDGWHHGGHTEEEQGDLNGLQMDVAREAGMAGGIVFSWFDEWFKKNWIFQPYALPAERKPFWFNLQDPEQNYGLLAAYPGYPGKKVTLSGNLYEWRNATTLYEKKNGPMKYRFGDEGDGSRKLFRLRAQHDEGFLYLLLEVKENIDFGKANYIIGINTSTPESGEFLLPFRTRLLSPIGLHFLIHLRGRQGSRILAAQQFDRYLNAGKGEIVPGRSDQGAWVVLQNRTNARRIGKDGARYFPSHVYSMSALRHGSLEENHPQYDSLADFLATGNLIEIRIPWCQLNFTDPSSRTVLWMDRAGKSRSTEGVRILAFSYRPRIGSPAAEDTGGRTSITDSFPERLLTENVRLYTWDPWDIPVYHTYLKKSYARYKEVLSRIPESV